MDIRDNELAQKIVNYSCDVKKGEKVLIECCGTSEYFIACLIKEIYKAGGMPFVKSYNKRIKKEILRGADKKFLEEWASWDEKFMDDMDAVILVSGDDNIFEYSDIPGEKMDLYSSIYVKRVHLDVRVKKKWVLLRYPTPSFAQSSKMSTEDFNDFYYKVCNLDYAHMCKCMDPLKALMEKTDQVKIVARNTNLTFSIKNIPAVKCCGECNIPDGELYTAPVKDSINGYITFNIPTIYNGVEHRDIRLTFKNGKIVEASSNNSDKLLDVLNTDEGSRYIGEFSFGLNPYINKPILDILFDEKMGESIHMAVGGCYDDAYNGNKSAIHWDLIQSHTEEYGGGEIYFDGVLIRKNGRFIPNELVALNKENLI